MVKLHDAAFYTASFFIFGVAIASLIGESGYRWLFLLTLSLLIFFIFRFLNKNILAIFSLGIFLGGAYYFIYDQAQAPKNLIFNQKVLVRGIIAKVSSNETGQQIKVGNVRAYLPVYPSYEYGDLVEITGRISPPKLQARNYLLKEGVAGLMSFPRVEIVAKNQGSFLKSFLNKFKLVVVDNISKVLPQEKASFMAGLLVGERSGFSQDFREALSRSGTSHLVALSGYNISIIAGGVALAFSYFLLSEHLVFFLTLIILSLFVIMTGAEASVVRAALMGVVMLLSNYAERQYSLRNALSVVAALMILQNPKILVFDLGFQLSFAALLGIVYLEPIIAYFFHFGKNLGFFNWRKNLTTTLAAQIAVLPIIATSFGLISFSGIFSNILILSFIPLTMFMGFMAALFGFGLYYFSLIFGLGANFLLSYLIFIINVFSNFGYVGGLELGTGFMLSYYFILVGGVWYFYKKKYI